jgi:hypothetical protein
MKYQLLKNNIYDLKLVTDYIQDDLSGNDLSTNLLIDINLLNSQSNIINNISGIDIDLEHVALNSFDNFLLTDGITGSTIDYTKTYTISSGDTFTFHEVSGYTNTYTYDVIDTIINSINTKKLNGGFYQGFYKLTSYPVEYFPNRVHKGWSVNMIIGYNTGITTGTTLNDTFPNNEGIVFYMGTQSSGKYSYPTDNEISIINENYGIDLSIPNYVKTGITVNNLNYIEAPNYTYGDELLLNNTGYTGDWIYYNGQPYTGKSYEENTSQLLTWAPEYSDLIDNAFAIRITEDKKIGYRYLYEGDICSLNTGYTDYYNYDEITTGDTTTTYKIINKKYTLIEEYTNSPIWTENDNGYINITITFERDITLNTQCELLYNDFRNGTLMIYVNGRPVLKNTSFREFIPHKLDVIDELQEGVPFNISFGGGTQGLIDGITISTGVTYSPGVLENYFSGVYTGYVNEIQLYNKPLRPGEVINLFKNKQIDYDLSGTFGGRKVFIGKP